MPLLKKKFQQSEQGGGVSSITRKIKRTKGFKRKMDNLVEPVPPNQDPLYRQGQNPNKRFRVVKKWPSTVSGDESVVTAASYGSANITCISAPHGHHILVDFGMIEERVHRGVFDKLSDENSFVAKGSEETLNLLNNKMREENKYFQENPNIPTCGVTKNVSHCWFVEKFVSSLCTTDENFIIFDCILITSRDTDAWNLLKYLLWVDGRMTDNRTVKEGIQIQCIVFHGIPEFLPRQTEYLDLIRAIVADFPTTHVYFGSFGNRLTSADLLEENLINLVRGGALPRMNFVGFSEDNIPLYRAVDGSAAQIPYLHALKMTNPNNVNDVYVELILPLINPHHHLIKGQWHVQSSRSCYNEDVLMVGALIRGYSFLFPSDASINIQEQYLKLVNAHDRTVFWDIMFGVHNSTQHIHSYSRRLYDVSQPKGVCLPMFYEKGYPDENCIKEYLSLGSLWNSAPHEIIYFKEIIPRIPKNAPLIQPGNIKPRTCHELKKRTSKLLFTLGTPVTFQISNTECLIAQDWSNVTKPEDD